MNKNPCWSIQQTKKQARRKNKQTKGKTGSYTEAQVPTQRNTFLHRETAKQEAIKKRWKESNNSCFFLNIEFLRRLDSSQKFFFCLNWIRYTLDTLYTIFGNESSALIHVILKNATVILKNIPLSNN